MEGDKGTVCVTGGTGFIASWLIMKLLQEGYSVHTAVRADPENKRDVSFLTNLPGATDKLKIFTADLNDPDSFDAAIEGCKGVFHVAAPIDMENKEPEEVVTKRAVNGALGILKSCLKSKTLKRVIYTSSASAVLFNNQDMEMMDESFWTDVDLVRKIKAFGSSYAISKTLTERACIEFAEEHGLHLVTIVPSLVLGPFICPNLPDSVHTSLAPVLGRQREKLSFLFNVPMVHVDDLSSAHIFLLEHLNATGRYNCSSHTTTLEKIVQILSKYPEFTVPTADSLAEIKQRKAGLSSEKLLDLGFKYNYEVEDMYDEAIKCCKEKGFLE